MQNWNDLGFPESALSVRWGWGGQVKNKKEQIALQSVTLGDAFPLSVYAHIYIHRTHTHKHTKGSAVP